MKRINELYDLKLHDPYMDRNIYKDPTICPKCNLVYHNKRWIENPEFRDKIKKSGNNVDLKKCPACRKTEDDYPMGVLYLTGDYIKGKKEEILNLIRNEERYQKKRNPLVRVMDIKESDDGIIVKTTTETLARKLGRLIDKAHHGELAYTFSETQKFIRVIWHKD